MNNEGAAPTRPDPNPPATPTRPTPTRHGNLGAGTITANLRHDNENVKSEVKGELIDTGRRKFGAIIADDVHTGINTTIYPGRKIWPGIGTGPGEIVDKDKKV